jgi:glutamate dehydrogenase
MGVTVVDEYPFTLTTGAGPRWLRRLGVRVDTTLDLRAGPLARTFEDALVAVLRGDAEDDGFNRLVLAAGLSWREATVLRALSRYLRQIGTHYSQPYVEGALATHAGIARELLELFVARCAPDRTDGRQEAIERLHAAVLSELDAVASLDEDRILRSLLQLVAAVERTNWFAPAHDDPAAPPRALAVKLDPGALPDLPRPRPVHEVFVHSPRVEGVHLRGGRVARGGIRWSDRREDFRTEVLDLMKAQMVKNAVIVPVGAKGGFVVKAPPADAADLADEVATCYRSFISALLDVTDNLVDGHVVPPPGVVRHDEDDPYLVVAADRGTASFSDLANELAVARDFWLGDAFASGGSAGFDHKRMGITARGAWVSVHHHFREMGTDVDTADVTVVGIGDMSGDVFGNAMLLSEHLLLVAAFDHRHVFLDPDPDPAVALAERRRLFDLPGSSWADYRADAMSDGGGVHPRDAKAVRITPQVRARLHLANDVATLTPNELIRAVLRAPVDLLFNGGIGTFVKATRERDADVADKANDPVRVDASTLRCRVVVEGGNLGLSQLARVELALRGTLVNTDAIDNSAGVDTSDHEVNIKILLDAAVRDGELDRSERDSLLASMTEEVATLVLRDNYRQNRAIANARAQSASMLHVHARFLRALEAGGDLDRELERLPDDEQLVERRNAGSGLTGPELAVLMAYAKVVLARDLLETDVADDPDLAGELDRYFPTRLSERFRHRFPQHRLRREIVVTGLVNGMVNRAGLSFAFRMCEESGASPADVVRAYEVARAVFDQDGLWREIEGLDGVVALAVQTDMYLESRKLVERACRWFLRKRQRPIAVAATIEHFRNRVARAAAALPDLLRGTEREWLGSATADYASRGVPHALALRVASLESLYTALDIVDVAELTGREVDDVASLHAVVGDRLRLDWLRDRVVELPRTDRWQSLSRLMLREDAYDAHAGLATAILSSTEARLDPEAAYDRWVEAHRATVERVLRMIDDLRAHGVYDLATVSVALREVRNLLPQAG